MKSRRPSNKIAMLKSQRRLQKIQCEETATKATAQHDELMETPDKSITEVGKNLNPIQIKNKTFGNI